MADTPRLARADVSESGALSSLATANGLTQLERLYLYSCRTIADGDLTPLLPMPRMHDLRMTNRAPPLAHCRPGPRPPRYTTVTDWHTHVRVLTAPLRSSAGTSGPPRSSVSTQASASRTVQGCVSAPRLGDGLDREARRGCPGCEADLPTLPRAGRPAVARWRRWCRGRFRRGVATARAGPRCPWRGWRTACRRPRSAPRCDRPARRRPEGW